MAAAAACCCAAADTAVLCFKGTFSLLFRARAGACVLFWEKRRENERSFCV